MSSIESRFFRKKSTEEEDVPLDGEPVGEFPWEPREQGEPSESEFEVELANVRRWEPAAIAERAIELARSGGILRRIEPYAKWVRAFGLMTMLGARTESTSEEHLAEIGAHAETAAAAAEAIPDGEASGGLVVEQAVENAQKYMLHIDEWKDDPAAGQVLQEIAADNPALVLFKVEDFADKPYAGSVIETVVQTSPHMVLRAYRSPDTENYPAMNELLHEVFTTSQDADVQWIRALAESGYDPREAQAIALIEPVVHVEGTTLEEARELVQDSHRFFEALVDTMDQGTTSQQYAAEIEADKIAGNDMMEMNLKKGKSQEVRFASVEDASAKELYGRIALAGDRARPSTLKPLFDRLAVEMRTDGLTGEQLLEETHGIRLSEFISHALAQNRFDDLVKASGSPETAQLLFDQMVEGVVQGDTSVEIRDAGQAVLFAEGTPYERQLKETLKSRYVAAVESGDAHAEQTIGLLSGLYGAEADWLPDTAELYRTERHESIEASRLFNKQGENVQAFYFYNDPDGDMSFQHFLGQYPKRAGWVKTDHGSFIELSKTQDGRTVRMFANKPEFNPIGEDDRREAWTQSGKADGVGELETFLESSDRTAQIRVHRGHAYWRSYTLDALNSNTQLYVDGSCGGASEADRLFKVSPEAQGVFNTDEGSAEINDTILRLINDRLLAGNDINWEELREQAAKQISVHREDTYREYIFPDQDQGAMLVVGAKYDRLALESQAL